MLSFFQTIAPDFTNWMEANVYATPVFAVLGLGFSIGIVFAISLLVWRSVKYVSDKVLGLLTSRRAGRLEVAGYKILLGPIGKKNYWRKRLKSFLVTELAEFLFSSTFVVLNTPNLVGRSQETAKRRLHRALADMVVWGEEIKGGDQKSIRINCLRRIGGGKAVRTHLISFDVPASKVFWRQEAGWSLVSYLIANGLQPILTTPRAFRREKVKDLVEKLGDIRASGVLELIDKGLKYKIEDEYCAGALHISEREEDRDYAAEVIAIRRSHLNSDEAFDDDRLIRMKMELGSALIRQSEYRYNNADVSDAMAYIADSIELMKKHPRIQLAQSANDQLSRAKGLLESRKRFALNFG